MSVEIVDIDRLAREAGEDKKAVRNVYEQVLQLALVNLRENPDIVDEHLQILGIQFRDREFEHFGESERLSPVRATALYLLTSRIPSFFEAAEGYQSSLGAALGQLAVGMTYISQSVVIAESAIHSGANKYVEMYSTDMLSDVPEEERQDCLQGVEKLAGVWAKRLQRYPDGIQFVKDELLNMHMFMSGYDPLSEIAVRPRSIFTPANVRGGKFAVDAYQAIYPRAAVAFGNGSQLK